MVHNPKQIRIEQLPLDNIEKFNAIIKDINNWLEVYHYDVVGMIQTPYKNSVILTITYRECCPSKKELD